MREKSRANASMLDKLYKFSLYVILEAGEFIVLCNLSTSSDKFLVLFQNNLYV